ncbi:hypothetical protein G6F65_022239 [Rhizopus arrhizus]|nr:hypothetical protein G6F65_022239 [Rhizopus arrhizus]
MGAALDILRQAATTLEIEANGVSDNPLVFTDTGEALSGGNFHAEPRAPPGHAGRPGAVRPAGVPDPAPGAEFRLHDSAGHRRRAGLGKQAARLPGQC